MTDSPVIKGDKRFEEMEKGGGGGGGGGTLLRTMLFSDIDMDCFVLNGGIPFCFTWI